MELILLENVTNLGAAGEIIKVADGYGRNFLIPKNKAVLKNQANLKKVKEMKQQLELKAIKQEKDARQAAEALEGVVVKISKRASDEGKLFGSVSTSEIVKNLEKQNIKNVEKKNIIIANPIKFLGEYEVKIKLFKDIEPAIKVIVEKEDK